MAITPEEAAKLTGEETRIYNDLIEKINDFLRSNYVPNGDTYKIDLGPGSIPCKVRSVVMILYGNVGWNTEIDEKEGRSYATFSADRGKS